MYPSWNEGGIWKVFYSVIWALEQRGKMTLIEKVNFWLFLVQRILPATESGPRTRATSMPMDSQLGVCQKTSMWLRGTWSREILFCPQKMFAKQKLAAGFMVVLLIGSIFTCKPPLVSAVLMFAFEFRLAAAWFSPLTVNTETFNRKTWGIVLHFEEAIKGREEG